MTSVPSDEVTRILALVQGGEASVDELLPLVYAELRRTADRLMRGERADHTLQPTALVHEAFLRLADSGTDLGEGRGQFLAVAARAMRNLLVDHSRARTAGKRGGGLQHVTLTGLVQDDTRSDLELLDLHEALTKLEELDERQARILEMCYFAGMTGDEIASQLGIHRNTVVRELRMARTWLLRELQQEHDAG